jgi:hypothetical protein
MAYTSITIDNFYNNPDEVRDYVLTQDFNITGNFPGKRTEPILNESTTEYISKLISYEGKVDWANNKEYNGSFQYTTKNDTSWIHADEYNHWAGVLYLTPNAPLNSGTGIFKHKETGLYKIPRMIDGSIDRELTNKIYNDAGDISKWELVNYIGNVYNRLVIYQGDLFHTSLKYFGNNLEDGRLFQTFFFDTLK